MDPLDPQFNPNIPGGQPYQPTEKELENAALNNIALNVLPSVITSHPHELEQAQVARAYEVAKEMLKYAKSLDEND